jgi:signal transduction histidine kinase
VLDTAHRAGMAEIASDVLHNVGNAMNSMNCAIEFLDERLQGSKIPHLDRAMRLLREQAPRAAEFFGQDPRGAKLIDYLADLSDALEDELHGNQADVARLQLTIRHIGDAIASQQKHAGRTDFRQDVDLPSLIHDALQLNQEMLDEAHVEVDVRVPTLPDVQLNRSKMLQILVNLIRNAAQAMRQHSEESRQLGISAQLFDDGTLELVVSDTGPGFDAVVQAQLFTYGFTTKPEGHGCGLHYCANAVNEVGGSIVAESAGPGLGASFRIRIPQAGPVAALVP